MIIVALFSCEDPTTLPVSKVFNGNRLQTSYVDTFSVMTSTVQLDSVLTSGSGSVLVGRYNDQELGYVAASSYFQVGYNSPAFRPDVRFLFDSIALLLHYNHTFSGDTTKAVTVNIHQVSEPIQTKLPPVITGDVKLSVFGSLAGFFNTTKFKYKSVPITSKSIKFTPHSDSLRIRLPDAFGAKWFKLAQAIVDSAGTFTNVSNFTYYYFNGIYLTADPSTDACVVGFKTNPMSVRIYYRKLVGDFYQPTHTDFVITDGRGFNLNQFNHIEYDRSGTKLAGAPVLKTVSSSATDNMAFVQSGTGLVARLDFPSLKGFFTASNGIILSAAYLDIYPVRGSYPQNFLPPSSLTLYTTDGSNIPLVSVGASNGGVANINYDHEYGVNTFYRYQIFPFVFSQLKASTNYFTPLILAPSTSQGGSVQRLYFGDRFNPGNKIKLNIFYTYALN
jgi:hypothetical protein